jgi:hypothetical protein
MSLLRSIGEGLRSPPALSDAEQQLQRLHVFDTCVTPCSVMVLTALTLVAQTLAVSLERVAAAIGAGTDLMVRFGVAIDGAHVIYRGGWPSSLVAPLGAAAAAAGLFGLDEKTAHALALALAASPTAIGRPSERRTGRWFLLARAAGNGMRAAQAARHGLRGLPLMATGSSRPVASASLSKPLQLKPSANLYSSRSQKPCQCLAAGRAFRSLFEEGLESCSGEGRSCSRSADLRPNDLGEAGSPFTLVSTDWCAAATRARGATTGMPLHGGSYLFKPRKRCCAMQNGSRSCSTKACNTLFLAMASNCRS